MNSYMDIFKRGAVAFAVNVKSELYFKPVETEIAWLRNGDRELTIPFKMPSNGHYYIAFWDLAFIEYVCNWNGLVNDCYTLHLFTLDGPFKTFYPDFRPEKVNESDKELHHDLCPQILPQARQAENANSAGQSLDQELIDGSRGSYFQSILIRPIAYTAKWAARDHEQ